MCAQGHDRMNTKEKRMARERRGTVGIKRAPEKRTRQQDTTGVNERNSSCPILELGLEWERLRGLRNSRSWVGWLLKSPLIYDSVIASWERLGGDGLRKTLISHWWKP